MPDDLTAARKNKSEIGKQDLLDAVDRIIGGLERKSSILTPAEKKKHDVFLDVLSEEDFLTYYTKKDRSDFCI